MNILLFFEMIQMGFQFSNGIPATAYEHRNTIFITEQAHVGINNAAIILFASLG